MPIRKLPTLLINQIAAGEVIERPASVVKELVENSLDAGATRVEVTVDDGGRERIRIVDNGRGIPPDELALAIEPHATSKLASAEDLEAIGTFGFRGEALASISSVSRLRLLSRATLADGRVNESAYVIEAAADQVTAPAPSSGAAGTVLEVRDLFFNTPARRKFMRAATTEFSHIQDALLRIALMHPGVSFALFHGARQNLDLPATDRWEDRCIAVLGKELAPALLAFEHQDPIDRGGYRVWGLAGQPAIAKATTKQQYVSLNGRAIRDRQITHAIKEAYRGLMPSDRQPVAAVFIEMDPRAVDVNVHPAKAEVRFREPSKIHGLVLHAIRQRLLGADLTPTATFRQPVPPTPPMTAAAMWEQGVATHTPELPHHPPINPPSNPPITPPSAPERAAPTAAPQAHGTPRVRRADGQPSARDAAPRGGGSSAAPSGGGDGFARHFQQAPAQQGGFDFQQARQALNPSSAHHTNPPPAPFDHEQATPDAPQPVPPAYLQIHKSYIVTQDERGLLIIDQHALHERVMFEQLRQRVLGQGKSLESQRLLVPEIFGADARRQATLEAIQPLLEKIGIEAEPIGPAQVAIHAFPSFLFSRGVEPRPFLEALLDRSEAEGLGEQISSQSTTAEEAALHEVLDMMACKAAVKAGDRMSEAELAALLAQREQIERSSNCPHGRPTTLRLTLQDLEKQFGRA